MIDKELRTLDVNDSLCRMLDYSRDALIGRPVFDFADEENRRIFAEQTARIGKTRHRRYEVSLLRRSG